MWLSMTAWDAFHWTSSAPDAVFGLVASGNLQGDTYDWDMSLDAGHVDMQALNMSATLWC